MLWKRTIIRGLEEKDEAITMVFPLFPLWASTAVKDRCRNVNGRPPSLISLPTVRTPISGSMSVEPMLCPRAQQR